MADDMETRMRTIRAEHGIIDAPPYRVLEGAFIREEGDADYDWMKDRLMAICGTVYEWRDANGKKYLLDPTRITVEKKK